MLWLYIKYVVMKLDSSFRFKIRKNYECPSTASFKSSSEVQPISFRLSSAHRINREIALFRWIRGKWFSDEFVANVFQLNSLQMYFRWIRCKWIFRWIRGEWISDEFNANVFQLFFCKCISYELVANEFRWIRCKCIKMNWLQMNFRWIHCKWIAEFVANEFPMNSLRINFRVI